MKIIDTHSHMYLPNFDEDRRECMDRALTENVYLTLLPNIDVSSIPLLKKTLSDFPVQTLGMMGLHPCSVNADFHSQLEMIGQELDSGAYVAIGETGIDLYWDKTYLKEQIESFETQIKWAKEKKLPIVIHARDSFDEIFSVLDRLHDENLTGVFHCFTGNREQAKKALNYSGFYLGLGGVLTFKNSDLEKTIEAIGIDKVVLETDAPYLTPHPHRSKRNETAYTRLVAEKLAVVTKRSVEEVARITTDNAKRLFKLDEI